MSLFIHIAIHFEKFAWKCRRIQISQLNTHKCDDKKWQVYTNREFEKETEGIQCTLSPVDTTLFSRRKI